MMSLFRRTKNLPQKRRSLPETRVVPRLETLEDRTVPSRTFAVGADAGAAPHVKAFDTATGATTFSLMAYNVFFTGGVRVAVGDINADGKDDLITGAGPGGGPHIKVFSGQDTGVIRDFFAFDPVFNAGIFIATGDVNDDGFDDIIAGAGRGGGPHVKAFSGADGTVLLDFFAFEPTFSGGARVATGDINQDNFDDVIVGAGPGGGPHVRAFSAQGGVLLRDFMAYDAAFSAGIYVASNDINGDGADDIITSAHITAPVSVFDGFNGGKIADFFAFDPGLLITVPQTLQQPDADSLRVGTVDRNGDGHSDIIVARGPGAPPEVRTFDGTSFTQIDSFFAYDREFLGGVYVSDN